MDGQVPATETLDASLVNVEADDVMPDVGQARGSHEADVSGSDDGDLHRASVTDSC